MRATHHGGEHSHGLLEQPQSAMDISSIHRHHARFGPAALPSRAPHTMWVMMRPFAM